MRGREVSGAEEGALPPFVAIVGPTAVGKTRFSLALAERFAGEIVSADSRQVYIGMDIGTAKPSQADRERVPHHLLDLVHPDEAFTLAQYQARAYEAIAGILGRGRPPFLVGGTGLYVRAVLEGFSIPGVAPDAAFRAELERRAAQEGAPALHAELSRLDPEAASRIDPRNLRRVIRALEVYRTIGAPMSQPEGRKPPPYRVLKLGLTASREGLYQRVDRRVEEMLERGLVEEVRGLLAQGYGLELPAMSGLGYREMGLYLWGEMSLEEAVRMLKRQTRRFARRQYAWFRPDAPGIRWFDVEVEPLEEMANLIDAFLAGKEMGDG